MKATQDETWVRRCERSDCRTQLARIEILETEVRDLKARLRAVRKESFSPDLHTPRRNIQDITDLRRKNWRKP